MKKTAFLLTFMAVLLLTGCSTAENGVSVGNVHNTECSHGGTRSADTGEEDEEDVGIPPAMSIKLTREGNMISGELINYRVGCSHRELYVDCQQEGKKLDISVHEKQSHGIVQLTSCLCWVNIYFTLYDVEGDSFQLSLDGKDMGEVSFKDSNIVEISEKTE